MDYAQAKAYVLRRLALGTTTVARLRQQLLRRGADPEVAQQLIDECCQAGYLSDDDYATGLIRQEIGRGYGPYAIYAKLASRGIAPATAQHLLAEHYPPERQQEAAISLMQKTRYRHLPRPKLLATLQRRGFILHYLELPSVDD